MFDLFGTLVDAPTRGERSATAARLAAALGCEPATVDTYLRGSWRQRHNGALHTRDALAAHLIGATDSPDKVTASVVKELRAIGLARLLTVPTVVEALTKLRAFGLRLGVLSDASPDIATVWPRRPLAVLADRLTELPGGVG